MSLSTKTITAPIRKATTITRTDKILGDNQTTTISASPKDNKATIVEGTTTMADTNNTTIGITTKDLDSTLTATHSSSTTGTPIKEISIITIKIDLKTKEVIGATFQVAQDRTTIITGTQTPKVTNKTDREMKEKRYLQKSTNKRWKVDDFSCQISALRPSGST